MHFLLIRPRGTRNPQLGKFNENKLLGLPRKQKRLNKHPKKTALAADKAPTKAALEQKRVKPVKVSLPVLVENAKLADEIFK